MKWARLSGSRNSSLREKFRGKAGPSVITGEPGDLPALALPWPLHLDVGLSASAMETRDARIAPAAAFCPKLAKSALNADV